MTHYFALAFLVFAMFSGVALGIAWITFLLLSTLFVSFMLCEVRQA